MNLSPQASEADRIQDLISYGILDTAPETAFDDLSILAASICRTPIALINLVDTNRIWIKSQVGLNKTELPRDGSFCSYAILTPDLFVVANALDDQRFMLNPLVVGAEGIRFYAGVPLLTPAGYRIGTLSVLDRIPGQLEVAQQQALIRLSHQIVTQLGLRMKIAQLEQTITKQHLAEEALSQHMQICQAALDSLNDHVAVLDNNGTIVATNESWKKFARTNGDLDLHSTNLGTNYLTVCRRSSALALTQTDPKTTSDAHAAITVDTGLRRILDGTLNQFVYEYPCHSPKEKRWFSLFARPLRMLASSLRRPRGELLLRIPILPVTNWRHRLLVRKHAYSKPSNRRSLLPI